MSDQSEAATETEAAEATEAEQDTATAEGAEAADEMSAAWQEMLTETGEQPAPEEDEDTDTQTKEETAASTDQVEEAEGAVASQEDQPQSEEAADIDWSKAPEELRSAFEAEKARADAAVQGRKSAEGRYAASQRRLDAMLAGTGDKPEEPANRSQESESDKTAEAEPSEAWKAVLEEYPDIAKPFAEELARVETGYKTEIDALKQTQQQMATALQTVGEDRLEATSAQQESIVREAHVDYDEIADSDDFVAWAESQPEMIRKGIEANAEMIVDAASVNVILDKYKADKGIASDKGNGAAAGEDDPGARKPAADPVRKIQLASNRGTPASSPGAPAREEESAREETFEGEWAKMVAAEERRAAAEARA